MPTSAASLLDKLNAAWPPGRWKDVTVIVAVSGGADSVALVRALAELREAGEGRLLVAHFNHRLRGAESDADQEFVGQLAGSLGCEVVVGFATANLTENTGGQGLEAIARQARYEFLTAAAAEHGARYVVTAHTADDQAETVLHHILRGTGLAGLAGIPRTRVLNDSTTLLRPLLGVTRADVLEYLRAIGQDCREDSTNLTEDYTRNRIRRQLLPQLAREYNPKVREALRRLAQIAEQADEYLNQQAEALVATAVRTVPGGVEFDTSRLVTSHPAIIRQALLLIWQQQHWPLADMSLEKWEQLLALVHATDDSLPITLPGGIVAQRLCTALRLTRHFAAR